MITHPGIYPSLSSVEYHSDPCPEPSLSQSLAKILLDRSPLHAWYAHPRLNPDFRFDDPTRFDIGNVAHAMLIGRGKQIEVLDNFSDWRTKDAQRARTAAAEAGKLAVLGKTAARAGRMVQAVHDQLALHGLGHLFTEAEGVGEVCLVWKEKNTWLRQLIDWLTLDYCVIADYKTTSMSAAPQTLGAMMMNGGWPIQAAMAERGLNALHPESIGRRQYLFVVQEDEPPYQINVVEISEAVLTMARKRLSAAIDTWSVCQEANRWPGYPLDILTPEMPAWAEARWLEREVEQATMQRHAENLNAG